MKTIQTISTIVLLTGCGSLEPDEQTSSQLQPLTQTERPAAEEADAASASDSYPRFLIERDAFGSRLADTLRLQDGAYERFSSADGKNMFFRSVDQAYSGFYAAKPVLEIVPFPGSIEEHEAAVMSLFMDAGLPSDQIERASTTITVRSEAQQTGVESTGIRPMQLESHTTRISRVVGGVEVPNSYAIARLDHEGRVAFQIAFWPEIHGSVVEDAERLKSNLSASTEEIVAVARGVLPSAVDKDLKVIITHGLQGKLRPPRAVYAVKTDQTDVLVAESAEGGELRAVEVTD